MHGSWQSNALNPALVLPSKLLEVDLHWHFLQVELGEFGLTFFHTVIQSVRSGLKRISRINQPEYALMFLQTLHVTLDILIVQLKCPNHSKVRGAWML